MVDQFDRQAEPVAAMGGQHEGVALLGDLGTGRELFEHGVGGQLAVGDPFGDGEQHHRAGVGHPLVGAAYPFGVPDLPFLGNSPVGTSTLI